MKLSEGQAHDGRSADGLLNAIGEGEILLADRGQPLPNRADIPAFSPRLYRSSNRAALGSSDANDM